MAVREPPSDIESPEIFETLLQFKLMVFAAVSSRVSVKAKGVADTPPLKRGTSMDENL